MTARTKLITWSKCCRLTTVNAIMCSLYSRPAHSAARRPSAVILQPAALQMEMEPTRIEIDRRTEHVSGQAGLEIQRQRAAWSTGRVVPMIVVSQACSAAGSALRCCSACFVIRPALSGMSPTALTLYQLPSSWLHTANRWRRRSLNIIRLLAFSAVGLLDRELADAWLPS